MVVGMARPLRVNLPDAGHHVTVRGTERGL
jgi:hypothetical protein